MDAFDDVGRIHPVDGSDKGAETIRICGIATLNAARLSDHFAPDRKNAEAALRKFFTLSSTAHRKKYLEFLKKLARDYKLGQAEAILGRLEAEMESKQDELVAA